MCDLANGSKAVPVAGTYLRPSVAPYVLPSTRCATYTRRLWRFVALVLLAVLCGQGRSAPSLIDQLLQAVGIGDGPCNKVGRLARAALLPATRSLRDAARAIKASNCERDLHMWAGRQIWRQLLPEPHDFKINVIDSKTEEGIDTKTHSALLPHEVFHELHIQARELFDELLTGGADNLRQWQQ